MTSRIRDKVLRFRGFETKKLVVHVQCGRTSKMGALKHIILLLCITISHALFSSAELYYLQTAQCQADGQSLLHLRLVSLVMNQVQVG